MERQAHFQSSVQTSTQRSAGPLGALQKRPCGCLSRAAQELKRRKSRREERRKAEQRGEATQERKRKERSKVLTAWPWLLEPCVHGREVKGGDHPGLQKDPQRSCKSRQYSGQIPGLFHQPDKVVEGAPELPLVHRTLQSRPAPQIVLSAWVPCGDLVLVNWSCGLRAGRR